MENLIGSDDNLDEFQIDCSEYRRYCVLLTGGFAHVGFKFQAWMDLQYTSSQRAPPVAA